MVAAELMLIGFLSVSGVLLIASILNIVSAAFYYRARNFYASGELKRGDYWYRWGRWISPWS